MQLYNALRAVPDSAQKPIAAGRLKGKTDINPMWRIKALTQQFGPCGLGWKYAITRQWVEAGAGGELSAFCNIDLFYKFEGAWSEAVPGTGGSAFVAQERGGLYTSDECFKMALTDAISVAAKALGVGADVYWEKDSTKYGAAPAPTPGPVDEPAPCPVCGQVQKGLRKADGTFHTGREIMESCGGKCLACYRKERAGHDAV